ncbi:MAG: M90 family metallopeptidase [Isosphaeraceae bacterium]
MLFDLFGGKRKRRQRLFRGETAADWPGILGRYVPVYSRLDPADRRELEGHARVFLAEKSFEGTRDLAVDDVMRLAVAGNACLLLMHRPTDYFPTVRSILLRPDEFTATSNQPLWGVTGGMSLVEEEDRIGEAGADGLIMLAWDEIEALAEGYDDAVNVVIHEFAHELDREDGAVNGVPLLHDRAQAADWERVCSAEFERLRKGRPERGALDIYGAEDPGEFFAVATEAFFANPVRLSNRHPALYDQLRRFYRLDMAEIAGRPGLPD